MLVSEKRLELGSWACNKMFKKLSSKSQAPFLFLKAKFDKSSVRTLKTPLWGGPVIYQLLFGWKLSIRHPFFEPFKVPPQEWVGGGIGTATMAAATGFWTAMFWSHFWSITSPTISELLNPSAHSSTARYFGSLHGPEEQKWTHMHTFCGSQGFFLLFKCSAESAVLADCVTSAFGNVMFPSCRSPAVLFSFDFKTNLFSWVLTRSYFYLLEPLVWS